MIQADGPHWPGFGIGWHPVPRRRPRRLCGQEVGRPAPDTHAPVPAELADPKSKSPIPAVRGRSPAASGHIGQSGLLRHGGAKRVGDTGLVNRRGELREVRDSFRGTS